MLGNNEFGQLGNGTTEDEVFPIKVKIPYQNAQKIACGNYYTLILTEEGHIFGFGSNHSGQLGTGNKKSSNVPLKALIPDDIVISNIAAGYHSAAISPRGELYVWGECALGSFISPQKISWNKTEVSSIQMGDNFTIVLDRKGQAWGFGNNTMGELGQGDIEEKELIVRIGEPGSNKIKGFSCGKEFVIALGDSNNETNRVKDEIRIERETSPTRNSHGISPRQPNSTPKQRYRQIMFEEEETSENKVRPTISDLESVSDRVLKAPRGSSKGVQERETKVMMDLAAQYTSPGNARYQKLTNGREEWKEFET